MNAAMNDRDCGPTMPFPEKQAWFTLLTAVVVYGGFIAAALAASSGEQSVLRVVILFTIALTVQGVSIGVAKPLLALRDPEEAKAPLDERDRTIARRAFGAAYIVLMGEVVLLAMAVPYITSGWQMTFAAYLTTIVADMVRHVAIIMHYRRHG